MLHRHAFEAFDRSARDISRNNHLFGGKQVVTGGDFRQIPPVSKRAGKDSIVAASLRRSSLLRRLHKLHLTVNMRVHTALLSRSPRDTHMLQHWVAYLLRLGDGHEPTVPQAGELHIRLPDGIVLETSTPTRCASQFLACLPAARP